MNQDQLTAQVLAHGKDIAALRQSAKSAHKRIDENDRIISGIHKLAANIQALTLQVKLLTDRMDSNTIRIEDCLKSHSERIGAVEVLSRTAVRNEASITNLESRVDAIELEPAKKWKDLARQMLALLCAAVAGSALAYIIR